MPAVVYAVGRTRALAVWLTALSAGGLLMLVSVFFWPPAGAHTAQAAIFLLVFSTAAMLGCWHFWRGQVPRRLRWDGERWWVIDSHGEQEGAQVQVRLDAQRWMLLWFRPVGSSRGRWLWAQASVDPQRWHLLRCALYSPMTSATEGAVPRADAERA
ncbi:hypothetical protein [Ottowia beijingensis]|uniref:hypothetical protein n=1 Tax=Ottowia beijingensis TaxID=1207057 RepID=UPI003625D3CF